MWTKYLLLLPLFAMGFSNTVNAQALDASVSPGAVIQSNTQPGAIPRHEPLNTGAPSNLVPSSQKSEELGPIEFETPDTGIHSSSQLQIQVQTIQLEGVSLLSHGSVEEVVKSYQNRSLLFSEIQTLAEKLTHLYVQAGYINSYVYIPPQSVQNGILVLRAVETRVNEIQVEEGRWFKQKAILPRVSLVKGDVLNIKPLSTCIRSLNENPDIKIQARLVKGDKAETTDIILKSTDHFPIHITPFGDNLGRRNIGNLRYGLTLNHNNLLGLGDRNLTSLSLNRNTTSLINQYILPVGSRGTELGFNYAYSRIKLGGSLKPLDILSSAQVYSPLIRQNIWNSERGRLTAQISFDFKNLDTNLAGLPFHRDRLRVLRPGFNGYINDRSGRTYLNQEFGIGLNILGGSTGNTALASKAGSGTQFFLMTGGLTRVQKLPWGTTGVLRSYYQYTPNRLISAEQIQIGGAYTVRGYQEGRQIGDKGFGLSAEWYVPLRLFFAKAKRPSSNQPLGQNIQLVAFSDLGQVFVNRPVPGEIKRSTLLGTGVGLRIQLTRFLVGRVDLGFPLIHQPPYENRARLHFGLQSNLF